MLYCPINGCGRSYKTLRDLREHYKREHFQGKCIACDFVTTSVVAMLSHTRYEALKILEGETSESALLHAIQYVLLKNKKKNALYQIAKSIALKHLSRQNNINDAANNPELYRKTVITVLIPKIYLNKINDLIRQGKYPTRSAFINTAIKNQLERDTKTLLEKSVMHNG